MKYKAFIDYKNFIPIDDTEVEKALRAMATDGKAFFKEGATDRIHAVLPDYHALMGWNYGYELTPEDWSLIGADKTCREAKNLLEDTKLRIAGKERPKQLSPEVKKLAEKMNTPTRDR